MTECSHCRASNGDLGFPSDLVVRCVDCGRVIDWRKAYDDMRWLAMKAIGDLGALCAPNVPDGPLVSMLRGIHRQRLAELDRLPDLN